MGASLLDRYMMVRRELEGLEEKLQFLSIRPGLKVTVRDVIARFLIDKGWCVVDTLELREGRPGYGSRWVKDCSDEERLNTHSDINRMSA